MNALAKHAIVWKDKNTTISLDLAILTQQGNA